MNDTEAYWWGWQITKTLGSLGRNYRDIRFEALTACGRCAGAGVWQEAPCGPCLGTGRITLGEVS
jgi:DnaJ-class molecular chaperone